MHYGPAMRLNFLAAILVVSERRKLRIINGGTGWL